MPIPIAVLAAMAAAEGARAIGSRMSSQKARAKERQDTENRTREAKRETRAFLETEAENRKAKSSEQSTARRKALLKRKAQSSADTTELIREALKL